MTSRRLALAVAWIAGSSACPGPSSHPGAPPVAAADDAGEILADPDPPLGRSYYRVWVAAGGQRAALVPRPDTELALACIVESDLSAYALRYRLCDVPTAGAAFVDRINGLSVADALAIKHALERGLRFCARTDPQVAFIDPEPLDQDVWQLCQRPGRAGLSDALCAYHAPTHTTLEYRSFSADDNLRLADELNALYGIDPDQRTCPPRRAPP